jgi:hypothetical protein
MLRLSDMMLIYAETATVRGAAARPTGVRVGSPSGLYPDAQTTDFILDERPRYDGRLVD